MWNTAQQQTGEGAMAARSRDDQIGFLFPCNFRNGLSRSSHTHPRDPESHAKAFPLQILNLLTDCGLNIGLIDKNRITPAPADAELIYVHGNEPRALSFCETPSHSEARPQLPSNRQLPR